MKAKPASSVFHGIARLAVAAAALPWVTSSSSVGAQRNHEMDGGAKKPMTAARKTERLCDAMFDAHKPDVPRQEFVDACRTRALILPSLIMRSPFARSIKDAVEQSKK